MPEYDRGPDFPRDPEYDGFRITTIWVYTLVGGDNEEGIPSYLDGDTWMPMIAADRNRLEALRPFAQALADASGFAVHLSRFSERVELEAVEPRRPGTPGAVSAG